jgi:lipopolysaccharide/colanic/teichoic acid biosynthesis glycosyltransferase
MSSDALNELVHRVSAEGVPVHLWNGLTRVSNIRIRSHAVAHEPFVVVDPPSHSSAQRFVKRALDVTMSLVLIVLAAPLMGIAAALIWAHDRGPVLFRQVRIGKDGRPFTVFKLRTMEVDAEARVGELWELNERRGPLFKVARDPRVTPIGNFLRSSALDELPQLFNVLAGQMSMVGPRPALPSETVEFDADLQRRHLTKPGVTGLWQVEANHKESFDEYRRLDLFYVDNWSVALDIAIIVDTVPSIGRRALRALRRSAPSAPVSVASSPSVPQPIEAGP